MAKEKGADKRQHKRLDINFLLKYETETSSGSAKITNIRNLSAGGAQFITDEVLDENSFINVSLLVPALEESFQAKAKVLRMRRTRQKMVYSVAVQFADLSTDERVAIDAYVEDVLKGSDAEFKIDHASVLLRTLKGPPSNG